MKKFLLSVTAILILLTANFVGAVIAENFFAKKASASTVTDECIAVIQLVNRERTKRGLTALSVSRSLFESAMVRAAEASLKFSHTRPNGYAWHTTIGYHKNHIGENLGVQVNQISAKKIVSGWMNSPDHRENILSPDFNEVGIGIYYANKGKHHIYWAMHFRG